MPLIEPFTIVIWVICLTFAAGHLLAMRLERPVISGLAKGVASASFVALAIANGAASSAYGRLILIALVLSWLGDVSLLSYRSNALLAGIAAFFAAHAAFALAFAGLGTDRSAFTVALIAAALGAFAVVWWLRTYVHGLFRIAVAAYLAVIALMMATAIGAAVSVGYTALGAAAVLFTISDVAVARNRFVQRTLVNKIWGLPLYYIAQLLFAGTIAVLGR